LFAGSLQVILKEYLLAVTSIRMFKYFAENQHFICSVVHGCYVNKMVVTEMLVVFI